MDAERVALDGVDAAEFELDARGRHASDVALEDGQPVARPYEKVGAALLLPSGKQRVDALVVEATFDTPGHLPTRERKPEVPLVGRPVREVALQVLGGEPAFDHLRVDLVSGAAELRLVQQRRDIRA